MSPIHHRLLLPWATHFTPLSLNFIIHKAGITKFSYLTLRSAEVLSKYQVLVALGEKDGRKLWDAIAKDYFLQVHRKGISHSFVSSSNSHLVKQNIHT